MNQMEAAIKILGIKHLPGDRPLKALVDVEINGLTIYGWRIVQKRDELVSVQYPTISYVGKDGVKKFRAAISAPGQLKQLIDGCIILAWREEVKNGIGINK